jgi:hypothetical protein
MEKVHVTLSAVEFFLRCTTGTPVERISPPPFLALANRLLLEIFALQQTLYLWLTL